MTAFSVAVTVHVDDDDPARCAHFCPYKSPRISSHEPLSATCTLFSAPIEYSSQEDDTDHATLRCQPCRDGAAHRPEGKP